MPFDFIWLRVTEVSTLVDWNYGAVNYEYKVSVVIFLVRVSVEAHMFRSFRREHLGHANKSEKKHVYREQYC